MVDLRLSSYRLILLNYGMLYDRQFAQLKCQIIHNQKQIKQINPAFIIVHYRQSSRMFDDLRTNLVLLILNIIALGNFSYPPKNQFLIIFVLFILFPLPYTIKIKMRIITLSSLVASFVVEQTVCQVFCMIALGLSISTAYELDLTQAPSMINTALGISQILSFLSKQYLYKSTINRDITLMIFTLPNLFLSYDCQACKSQALYLINPFLDDNWLYSVGFILGIYTTSLTSMEKHYKFFCISIILLIEAEFHYLEVVVGALSFVRGLLIYTQQTHQSQKYFLMGFLIFKIFFHQFLLYFMFVGYLIIGVIIFQQARQRKQLKRTKKDQSMGTQQVDDQMYQMNQLKKK